MLHDRRFLLADLHGPVTVVLAHRATPAEKAKALRGAQGAAVVGQLVLRSLDDVASLAHLLPGFAPLSLSHHLVSRARQDIITAARNGRLLVVPEWTFHREVGDARTPVRSEENRKPGAPDEPRKAAFMLELIDGLTGGPVADVPLRIRRPTGETAVLKTDVKGAIHIPDVELGACEITSVIDGARSANSYEPTPGMGAGPATSTATTTPGDDGSWVLNVARHRVATGETPSSIAKRWNLTWAEIAHFNWGTQDPIQLETCYRDELGCTKKRLDGPGLRFDDSDEPGILLIPYPWEARLEVGPAHRIRLQPLRTLRLCLENEHGVRVPGARFVVRFTDGSERRGALGRAGVARLEGVPDAAFAVSYPDPGDVLARSLAASVHRALQDQTTGPLFQLLGQEQTIVDKARAVYEEYFNDLSGRGLEGDIDQMVTDPEARAPLLYFCALAGLEVEGRDEVILPPETTHPGW